MDLDPATYAAYRQRERTRDYDLFASDSHSKPFIEKVTRKLAEQGRASGLSRAEMQHLIVSFVQDLPYTSRTRIAGQLSDLSFIVGSVLVGGENLCRASGGGVRDRDLSDQRRTVWRRAVPRGNVPRQQRLIRKLLKYSAVPLSTRTLLCTLSSPNGAPLCITSGPDQYGFRLHQVVDGHSYAITVRSLYAGRIMPWPYEKRPT